MSRVALVTGGTRGIGAAISVALKNAGYKVAANFAGNEEKAKAFEAETGIPVFKWDVSNYQACVDGIAAVEARVTGIGLISLPDVVEPVSARLVSLPAGRRPSVNDLVLRDGAWLRHAA